ncbi:MAG: hypothetical protein GYA62_06750 [Bacteroidales bacterium]|nr:hypothetical protein [Bacteroidales bacterium]
MKTSLKLLIITVSLQFILSLIAIIVFSSEFKNKIVFESGKMISIKQPLKTFKAISISGSVTVHWKKSDSAFVDLSLDSIFKKDIVLTVQNETLNIKAPNVFRKKKMVFVLYSPDIMEIQLNEGAVLLADDTLKGNLLKMKINNGADAKIKFNGQFADIFSDNGSSLILVGSALNASIKSMNGSNVKMDHFELFNGNFVAESGSSVDVLVKDSLTVHALSGSKVNIYGNPKVKKIKTDISSSVE